MRATIAIAAIGVAAAVWRVDLDTVDRPAAPSAAAPATVSSDIGAGPAPARTVPMAPRQALPAPSRGAASAPGLASVEAAVRAARRGGQDEQEVHRLRSAALPAAQVEAIARMEAAEAHWRRRIEALHSACASNVGCQEARASFTQEELAHASAYAAPTLRQ
jgi:hypothetical protein